MVSITTLSVQPQPEYTQNLEGDIFKCDQCTYMTRHCRSQNSNQALQWKIFNGQIDFQKRGEINLKETCPIVKSYLEEMITNISPPLSTFCQVTVCGSLTGTSTTYVLQFRFAAFVSNQLECENFEV